MRPSNAQRGQRAPRARTVENRARFVGGMKESVLSFMAGAACFRCEPELFSPLPGSAPDLATEFHVLSPDDTEARCPGHPVESYMPGSPPLDAL
jgi:hypothetical protein